MTTQVYNPATHSFALSSTVNVYLENISTSFTRPSDTTPYDAYDAISNSTSSPTSLTFSKMSRDVGYGGNIVGAVLETNNSSAVAQIRLYLYTTNPTAINDNSPFTLLYTSKDFRIGYIDFPSLSTSGAGSTSAVSQWVGNRFNYLCASNDTSLYGLLVSRTADIPTSGQQYNIKLLVEKY